VFVSLQSSGRVSIVQPPQTLSGMTGVQMDTKGRLVLFSAVPPQIEEPGPPAPEPDWSALFAEAGLDHSRFRSVAPQWIPEDYADRRAAWEGPYASRDDIPVRIEAASHRGVPTWFEIVAPWGRPQRMLPFQLTARQTRGVQITVAIFLGVIIAAVLLARRHLLLGRGDRRGATRLALFTLAIGTAVWAMEANHAADAEAEITLFARGMASNLLAATLIFVLYLALEPFVRRRWPRALVTWTRLLAGRISDPLVGRDVLVGTAAGSLVGILAYVADTVPRLLGAPPPAPWWLVDLDPLLGPMMSIAEILGKTVQVVGIGLGVVLLLLLLRTIVRREWLAAAILVAVLSTQAAFFASGPWWTVFPVAILIRLVPVVLTLRFGVLATIVCIYVSELLVDMPINGDFASWKATPTLMAFAVVILLAIHGFRSATAGRPLVGERMG
jgi:serine/threonine-protein kinase